MFIEVQTIWKNMPPDPLFAIQQNSSPCDNLALLSKEPGQWAWRRVGVLFSKQDGVWTFIVLIGPETEELEADRKGKKVTKLEKGFVHLQMDENPGEKIANACWRNGSSIY